MAAPISSADANEASVFSGRLAESPRWAMTRGTGEGAGIPIHVSPAGVRSIAIPLTAAGGAPILPAMPLRVSLVGLLLSGLAAVCAAEQPVPLGDEFKVNTGTDTPSDVAVAVDAAGGFVVVWQSAITDPGDVFARRYDATGNPVGSEFRVNTY